MDSYHVRNIDALIAVVHGRHASQIGLGMTPIDAPAAGRYRPCELIAFDPHFLALGVVPPVRPGLAGIRLTDGARLDPQPTLLHLFGRFGRHAPTAVLTPDFGRGCWDAALIAWFPLPPTHKELALARLLYAREVARGLAAPESPGAVPPAAVGLALGLPAEWCPADRHLSNLRMLLQAAGALRGSRLFLTPFEDGCKRRLCLPDLVAAHVYFQAQGVTRDRSGAPVMRRSDGSVVSSRDTLDHLFGSFGGWPAHAALFAKLADGCWDYQLMGAFAACPSEHQVALARLRRARHVAQAQLPKRNPTPLPAVARSLEAV